MSLLGHRHTESDVLKATKLGPGILIWVVSDAPTQTPVRETPSPVSALVSSLPIGFGSPEEQWLLPNCESHVTGPCGTMKLT